MANIMTKRGNLDNIITYEHICDTIADMANIPSAQITLGSVCIVLEGTSGGLEVYMANSNKQWDSIMSGISGSSNENQTAQAPTYYTINGSGQSDVASASGTYVRLNPYISVLNTFISVECFDGSPSTETYAYHIGRVTPPDGYVQEPIWMTLPSLDGKDPIALNISSTGDMTCWFPKMPTLENDMYESMYAANITICYHINNQ